MQNNKEAFVILCEIPISRRFERDWGKCEGSQSPVAFIKIIW